MDTRSRVVLEEGDGELDLGNDPASLLPIQKKEENDGVVSRISKVVRWISNSMLGGDDKKHFANLLICLENSTMFRLCSKINRQKIASIMIPMHFEKGDVLMFQGQEQTEAFVIVEGNVVRKRLVDDQYHTVGTLGYSGSKDSIGMLHLLEQEPSYSTVVATSDGVAFVLSKEALQEQIDEDATLASEIIHSLVVELRRQTYIERTPLFLQQGKQVQGELNWFAVSVAASVESFYRSGLNALLISQLTGKPAAWFPNMHIQIPTRIVYINGFKGIRFLLEKNVDPTQFQNPQLAGLGLALIPGIIMTPASSVLEASNVTHMNNEALIRRWTRGLMPRCVREVIFGVGINQLSDFCEERFDSVFPKNKVARNFAGSLMAGAVAGYLSHIPHNLSMLKLVEPHKSYATHFKTLRDPWKQWLGNTVRGGAKPTGFSATVDNVASALLTVGLPKGCLVRTAQISGSFIIINSTINALSHINVKVHVDTPGVI